MNTEKQDEITLPLLHAHQPQTRHLMRFRTYNYAALPHQPPDSSRRLVFFIPLRHL